MRGVQPCTWRGEGLNKYYLKGPFTSRKELLADLERDPMLKSVYAKWSSIEKSDMEAAFIDCMGVYLQIRWMGWYSRPMRKLSKGQFVNLLRSARAG